MLLDIKDRIVIAAAIHMLRATSEAVCAGGGDYVLALEGNQGACLRMQSFFRMILRSQIIANSFGALMRIMAPDPGHTRPPKRSMRGKIRKARWSGDFMLDMNCAAVQA